MGAQLEALRALQDVELQIVDIRRQLAAKERAVKRQSAKLRSAEEAHTAARDDLKHTQVEMDALDVDVKARNGHIAQLRDNLSTVKTNKEYAAVMAQLNNEKADLNRLEQRAYQLLETVEEKKKVVSEQEQLVKDEAARLENLKVQFSQSQTSFSQHLEQLKSERTTAANSVEPKFRAMFERVSERYEGEVMAEVIRTHPRRDEFMCDGCQMALAMERANALMSRDEIITCDNCGRILYIERHT